MRKEQDPLMQGSKESNIMLRALSALIIVSLFTISIIWCKLLFYTLILLVAICMLCEWHNMTKSSALYLLLGFIIIPIPIISLILLRIRDEKWLLLYYFVIIWSVDTFAMIGGKSLQGLKLAPYISPNKTWSGLIIGVVSVGLISVLLNMVPYLNKATYYFKDEIHLIITSIFLALTAQVSDLFISYFKRKFNIKDSGSTIPGHGGFLDRFDSIIFTAPMLFFII